MLVKKVTYFGKFSYLNGSCIRINYYCYVFEFFERKIQAFVSKLSDRCFCCFRPPCWCPSRWAPAWRLHTNLYKFGENVSPHISNKKNCCDLNLGESLCIATFFLFPDSRPNLLNGFDFFILIYFEWRDTENQQHSIKTVVGHFNYRFCLIEL